MKQKRKPFFACSFALVVVIGVVYASLPYYARQALIHWMPVIDDLETFHRHTVHHNPMTCGTGPFLLIITASN